ncbi:MAG: phospholipase D family protein [Kiloniellaceae bacterium]
MMRFLTAFALLLGLTGCATLPADLPQGEPSHALAPQPAGPLAETEVALRSRLGPEESGFRLLDSNAEGLRWRLALIDSAQYSLDLQYYVWWGDETGALLMKRTIMAADRGVRVRIIVDDLTTILNDADEPKLRDAATAVISSHPNIEIRLFNPWRARGLAGRIFETLADLQRTNQRMHNKMMIADNRATIIGGRNIGNEYFGLHETFNFRDLDTIGIGPVARQASEVFDRFWNSEMVLPAGRLGVEITPEELQRGYAVINRRLAEAAVLSHFKAEPQDWRDLLDALAAGMVGGESHVYTDAPEEDGVDHIMPAAILDLLASAEREVLITNAYIIPNGRIVDWIAGEIDRGVRYRILTNSLASHDVPAVNSHYRIWRDNLLRAGVELYEARPDAAERRRLADTPPVESRYMGLHVKAMVIDRQRVFIGSMNLDPRSWAINSEMGVVVESPALAEKLADVMDESVRPENAWRLERGEAKKYGVEDEVLWIAGDETLRHQPTRDGWQLFQDFIFAFFPRSLY